MGRLVLPEGLPDFSSGLISVWFFIPDAAIEAARAEYLAWLETDQFDSDLKGIIPLMTFGPNTEIQNFLGTGDSGPMSPCVIGVVCNQANAQMYARFQYDRGAPGEGLVDCNDFFQVGFAYGPVATPSETFQPITVTPNVWHHILISFDFSGGCSSSGVGVFNTCPFYWAFDGVNKSGNFLWPGTPSAYGQPAQQGIVSEWCRVPPRSFAAGAITTHDKPFAFPTEADRSSHIYGLVMARGQVFTNVPVLDLSDVQNIRAFVTSNRRPAHPDLARELLGKAPEIEFRRGQDWVDGINSGSAGNFLKTGTVRTYADGP